MERFIRLSSLIGNNKLKELINSTVLVLGCGGVGGYVIESLARSGIGTLIIVDYDIVDISNINRQIIALTSTIGMKKVDCLYSRIKDINPACTVIKIDKFINEDNYLELFNYKVDFIADCCDSINIKKLVIKYALNNNINIISSMGTGNKMDPSMLEIIDIKKTSVDPIARIIRKYLKDEKINKKFNVLCSKEIPRKVEGCIASNSFVPPTAGLLITSYIVKELIK